MDAGGKGINVSKTIKALGGDSIATGFLGGNNGNTIVNMLASDEINAEFMTVEGETRINTKIVESDGSVTELNEAGPEISEEEQENIPTYLCRNYARVDSLKDLKKALADRKPVLMGITCGEDIYDPVDGCVGLPLGSFIIGGHAILAIGYDDERTATIKGRSYKGFVECQNSWGETYGDGGFFWLPYEYVTYKTKDFGQSFLLDMFTTVDLADDDLQGTTIEMRLGEGIAYDDGKEILLDQLPMADEKTGRTLVPLRFIGETLGCRVEWLKASRQIIIRGEATDIQLTIGNQVAIVNGDKRLMDQAPVIDQRTNRTLVPLRFIAQALGNVVLWDGKHRKIIILKK
jgi:hypothetical protein